MAVFRNIIFLSFIGFCVTLNLHGQDDPLLRIEIPTKSDEAKFRVIPAEKQGLIFFYQTTQKEDNYKFWVFYLYSTYLQETWKTDIPMFSNMTYSAYTIVGDNLYCFFHDQEKKKSEDYNCQVLKLNISTGRYEMFSGVLPDKSQFVSFDVMGNLIIVGLNLDKGAGVYSFDMTTRETKTVYEITEEHAVFEDLFIDKDKQSYLVLFNVHASRTAYYLLLKSYNAAGEELNTIPFIAESGKKFNTGKIAPLNGDIKLVVGTFDVLESNAIDYKDYFVKEAAGFYTINITDRDSTKVRYQNFLDLENMTGYLKGKEFQLAKKKAEKNQDNKEKYSVNYDLLIHDIVERDSMIFFIGEAYYEDFHMVNNNTYDYYGRLVPISYMQFDGYRFFNAFVSCYDFQGNKLWDNGMEIFNLLTPDLRKQVCKYFDGDDMVLAYNRDGKINAKIINGPDVVEGVESFPIETTYVNDQIISDTKSNMEHWYGNYFVAYGFQTIRNNSLIDNNKRLVFYINKVGFQ